MRRTGYLIRVAVMTFPATAAFVAELLLRILISFTCDRSTYTTQSIRYSSSIANAFRSVKSTLCSLFGFLDSKPNHLTSNAIDPTVAPTSQSKRDPLSTNYGAIGPANQIRRRCFVTSLRLCSSLQLLFHTCSTLAGQTQ